MSDTTIYLKPGGQLEIAFIYPTSECISLYAGEDRISVHCVSRKHMLELVQGIPVARDFAILGSDNHKGSQTKQDAIDYIEDLIADREEANDAPTV